VLINFSLSPTYLLNIVDALKLKKVHYAFAAAAFANNVLPQPGAEYNNIPLQLGKLLKYYAHFNGNKIASSINLLVVSIPAISSYVIFEFVTFVDKIYYTNIGSNPGYLSVILSY